LLALAAIAAVVAGAWAGAQVIDNDPDLNGKLVDANDLDDCLREAPDPAENWRIGVEDGPDEIGLSWGSRDGEVERSSADLLVLPTEGGAEEMESLLRGDSNETVTGQEWERWGNLLRRQGNGDSSPEPTDAVAELLDECAEDAATQEASAAGSFNECDPPGDRRTAGLQWMTVRGMECAEAREQLKEGFAGEESVCEAFEGPATCVGALICCTISANYVGGEAFEIVYRSGF
jgi:hypothetical protein